MKRALVVGLAATLVGCGYSSEFVLPENAESVGIEVFKNESRWVELERDTAATQSELLGPLSVASATTVMGYSGMLFANHAGLHSIGVIACIGLVCIWFTTVVLFPGVLRWAGRRGR